MKKQSKSPTPITPRRAPIMGVDLAGKLVYVPRYADPCKVFKCQGGFGCNPEAAGSAVFGTWIANGDADRIERGAIEGLATREDIKTAEDFAALPAPERFKKSLAAFWELVDRRIETPGKTKEALLDSLFVVHREFNRLRHYLTYTDGSGSQPVLDELAAILGADWDAGNKRRQ